MSDKEIIEKELNNLVIKFGLDEAFAIRCLTVAFLEDYLRFYLVEKYKKDFNFRLLSNRETRTIDVSMDGWIAAGYYEDIYSMEYKGKEYLICPNPLLVAK